MNQNDEKEYAVIYARYSSDNQREESIEGQLRDCRAFAARNNLVVIEEYCDRALTGRTDKRPEFQRMIRDSAKKAFSVVVCWKGDRFSRSRYDSAMYKYKLKQNGVRLLYAMEHIPEGAEGIILESVMEGLAEFYSANLSQNIKRGMYDSALEGKAMHVAPYGLKIENGMYAIDGERDSVVRRVFSEYANGDRAVKIAGRLNEEGLRTNAGKLFCENSIYKMLKNEKYIGVYRYGDIVRDDGIPAIIDAETWSKVRSMMDIRKKSPHLKKNDGGFILTGKVFCGRCGEPMVGDSGTSKTGAKHYYYTCKGKLRNACEKRRNRKEELEDRVLNILIDFLSDEAEIDRFIKVFMEWQKEENKVNDEKLFSDELKQAEKEIENLVKAIASGVMSDTIVNRINQLEERKSELKDKIADAKLSAGRLFTEDEVRFFMSRNIDRDLSDYSFRIYLVENFLKKVYVYDDKLILELNYCGDTIESRLNSPEEAEEMICASEENDNEREGARGDEFGYDCQSSTTSSQSEHWHIDAVFCAGVLLVFSRK